MFPQIHIKQSIMLLVVLLVSCAKVPVTNIGSPPLDISKCVADAYKANGKWVVGKDCAGLKSRFEEAAYLGFTTTKNHKTYLSERGIDYVFTNP